MSAHAGYELDFFAFPGISMAELTFASGVVTAAPEKRNTLTKLGMKPEITLADYDFTVIIGCGLSIMLAARALRRHWQPDLAVARWRLRERLFRIAPRVFPPSRAIISENALDAAIDGAVGGTIAIELLNAVRQASDIPVILASAPLPSVRILNDPAAGLFLRMHTKTAEGDYIRRSLYQSLDRVIAGKGQTCTVRHPEVATQDALFTPERFGVDALRLFDLRSTFGKDELWHANGAYGALILAEIFAAFEANFQKN